mgnify:CR=1 FL=1
MVIAPQVSEKAKNIISKKKNVRLLSAGGLSDTKEIVQNVKSISGGFLVQTNDNTVIDDSKVKVVTERDPSEQEIQDLYLSLIHI